MQVNNVIAQCVNPSNPDRGDRRITGLVLHRINLLGCETGADIANIFKGEPAVGRCMPYHFVGRPCGAIDQCLPLDKIGWHALGHSKWTLGVALMGDFRKHEPTKEQISSLVWLVRSFSAVIGRYDVTGHTNLPNASKDPNKVCPGEKLNIQSVIRQAKLQTKLAGMRRLEESGVVLLKDQL